MKGLTATIIIFVHAIQCQRRKLPEIINPRVHLTSSVGISVEKADGTVIHKGTFKNKLNSGWQCRRLKLIPLGKIHVLRKQVLGFFLVIKIKYLA